MTEDHPKLAVIPSADDSLRGSMEALKRTLPILAEAAQEIANARKAMFDAHINAGFSESQALTLCRSLVL